jgi:dihydropteridine reductase
MNIAVIGGAGALGRSIVNKFVNEGSHKVINIDLKENDQASDNILIKGSEEDIDIKDDLEVVICAAGSWEPTPPGSPFSEVLATWKRLESTNIKPALLAASLAINNHNPPKKCKLFLTSAIPSLHACKGMVEYGMAKAATNMLASSIASEKDPKTPSVTVLMPAILDTQANRGDMPNADFSSWTPTADVAKFIYERVTSIDANASGASFITIKTKNNQTEFTKIENPFN